MARADASGQESRAWLKLVPERLPVRIGRDSRRAFIRIHSTTRIESVLKLARFLATATIDEQIVTCREHAVASYSHST
jgi:hypothetical protein